jgi:hypothetical protein
VERTLLSAAFDVELDRPRRREGKRRESKSKAGVAGRQRRKGIQREGINRARGRRSRAGSESEKDLADHPRTVPIVLTKDTNLAAMYNAQVYPIYVVIDRDGNIAAEQRGSAGERGLRRLLRRAGLEGQN